LFSLILARFSFRFFALVIHMCSVVTIWNVGGNRGKKKGRKPKGNGQSTINEEERGLSFYFLSSSSLSLFSLPLSLSLSPIIP
jgi:hypothetical protein